MNFLQAMVSPISSLSALGKGLQRDPYREMETGYRNPDGGQSGAVGRVPRRKK